MSFNIFKAVAGAAVLAAVAPHAAADVVDCTAELADSASSVCSSIPAALAEADFSPDSMELTSNEFLVNPDAPEGTTADLQFTFVRDDGAFQYEFGVCLTSAIDADLLSKMRTTPEAVDDDDRFNFAVQCFAGIFKVFDDADTEDVSVSATIADVPVPAELVFALVPTTTSVSGGLPSDSFEDFNALTDEEKRAAWDNYMEKPLFSESPANPEGRDQLAVYCDGGQALLQWEDVSRASDSTSNFAPSDNDFGDLAFIANFEIVAPPPPPSGECGADCDSAVSVEYVEGVSATATGDKCATLCFDCAE